MLFALWAHLVERMTFQYLFLQNTSGRNTEWGILCFRVLLEGSRHKQLQKQSMSWVGNIFCCHRKLEPKSDQGAKHWSPTSSLQHIIKQKTFISSIKTQLSSWNKELKLCQMSPQWHNESRGFGKGFVSKNKDADYPTRNYLLFPHKSHQHCGTARLQPHNPCHNQHTSVQKKGNFSEWAEFGRGSQEVKSLPFAWVTAIPKDASPLQPPPRSSLAWGAKRIWFNKG